MLICPLCGGDHYVAECPKKPPLPPWVEESLKAKAGLFDAEQFGDAPVQPIAIFGSFVPFDPATPPGKTFGATPAPVPPSQLFKPGDKIPFKIPSLPLGPLLKGLLGELTKDCPCPACQAARKKHWTDRPLLRERPLVAKDVVRHNRYAVHRQCKKKVQRNEWLNYVYCKKCKVALSEGDLSWKKRIPKEQKERARKMARKRAERFERKKKERE